MTASAAVATEARSPLLKSNVSPWIVTVIAAIAQFMIVLDERVVNIALPAIGRDLGMAAVSLQWVITAYLVTFGGLLLFGARISDLFGRRRVFIIGLVMFTVASLVGGFAPNGGVLIAARLVQGGGAAIVAPSSLTLISAINTSPSSKARGMSVWAVTTSAGAAAGVVLGGLLTDWLGWQSVMFVNVPICVALVFATLATLVPSKSLPRTPGKLDLVGAALVTLGIAALIYGLAKSTPLGWGSAVVTGSLAVGVIALVLFVVVEQRSKGPLFRLGLLSIRTVRVSSLSLLSFGAAMTGALYYLSLYLQQGLYYTPLQAGLALLPMSIVLGIGSLLAPRVMRAGIRRLPSYGAIVAAAGLIWLALAVPGSFTPAVLLPSLVLGAGFSVVLGPIATAATTGVPVHELGMASGLLNVTRQLGGAVGLAILVTITSSTARSLDAGYSLGFALSAALCVITAVIAIGLVPRD